MRQSRIYLDHAATTPLLPAAREAMADALARWHNPSSPHAEGRAARAVLEGARERIAAALHWSGKIVFTSGASEALAIALSRAVLGPRLLSAVEHDSVFRAAPGAETIAVDADGLVAPAAIRGERPLVAVQHANSETGVVQPLAALREATHVAGGILLVDAAQTAGKLALPAADLIAISAHKFGGPPGVGALLLRDYAMIEPVGGQERGYRYGTENLPGIVAMAAALEARTEWLDRAAEFRERLETRIVEGGGEVVAPNSPRIAPIGAYRMPGVASAAQLIQFDTAGIAVSAGSACSSGSLKPSHVLSAMGWEAEAAGEVVRVSFGPSTSEAEIDRFASQWDAVAARQRRAA